jgi:DnaJ-class molecular chaperone
MPTETPSLKPCPKCQGAGFMQRVSGLLRYKVFCRKCGFGTQWYRLESLAVREWNRG